MLLAVSKTQGRATCESPWKEFKGKCFLFSTVRQSYEEAQKMCYGQGGFLASVRNGEEFRFVSRVIQTFGAHYSTQGWFIGMHQINITGSTSFRWLDGSVAGFQNWMSSQPNNIYEECVMMDGTSGLKWRDELCTKRSFFVCRREEGQMECFEGEVSGSPEYDVSVTGCVEQCRGQGYSLAAISDDKCGCYNTMDSNKFKPKQRIKCNALCAGQHCGANGHVAVYNIKSYHEVASTCEDLSNVGINKPGTYILQKDVKTKGNDVEVGPGTSCFSGSSSKNPSTRPENGMKSETVTISFTDEATEKPCVDCQREETWNKAGFGYSGIRKKGNFGSTCRASFLSIVLTVIFCLFKFCVW